MFDKINVWKVVKDHLDTLKVYGTQRADRPTFVLLFVLPLAVAGAILYWHGSLDSTPITIVATSFSIFAALLFNLLLLIYDVIRKPDKSSFRALRRQLLRDLFRNISFAILTAIVGVALLIALALFEEDDGPVKAGLSYGVYYLALVFVLTLLIVLKRVHVLLSKELESA